LNLQPSATTLAGSPKTYGLTGVETNGWEGPMLSRLIAAYSTAPRTSTWPSTFSVDDVPILSIGYDGTRGYPAIPAEAKASIFQDLVNSSARGAHYAIEVMDDFAQSQPIGCTTRFIAVGYSQGAMAARVVAQLSPDTVAGVIDFGDPYQKPNSVGNEGTATNGVGIVRWWLTNAETTVDKFYTLPIHKTALCHAKDPICSYSWLFGLPSLVLAMSTHLNYLESTEAFSKGRELANLAASLSRTVAQRVDGPDVPPQAQLETADTQLTGLPTVFSAAESVTSTSARTFDFDSDGDGVFERIDTGPALDLTFESAGTYTVHVRVTDDEGRSNVAAASVSIETQADAVRSLPDPSNPSTLLHDVTLSSVTTSEASPSVLTVGDLLASDEQLGARIVPMPSSAAGIEAWDELAAAVYGDVTTANKRHEIQINPYSLPAGKYALLIFTDQGRHAELEMTVAP
jgi:hypothetical protein